MQTDWIQALLFPLITGVTLLAVEYFVIQPWLRLKETRIQKLSGVDSDENKRKWSDGIKNAIVHFKKIPNPYVWDRFSIKQNFVFISQMAISKGQAEISLSVTERYILDFFGKPKEISRYKMIIDRIGEIYRLDSIPQKNKPFESNMLPFPVSWLIIGAILLIGVYSQLPEKPIVNEAGGHPVADLWSTASQITVNSSINGTIGINEVDAYIFNGAPQGLVTIKVTAIEDFLCHLRIYNTNNSLVRSIGIGGSYFPSENSITLAPELNASYLLIILPYEGGGSYVLNISTTDVAP